MNWNNNTNYIISNSGAYGDPYAKNGGTGFFIVIIDSN